MAYVALVIALPLAVLESPQANIKVYSNRTDVIAYGEKRLIIVRNKNRSRIAPPMVYVVKTSQC